MASSPTHINTLQMQTADELEHTKRFIIDVNTNNYDAATTPTMQ